MNKRTMMIIALLMGLSLLLPFGCNKQKTTQKPNQSGQKNAQKNTQKSSAKPSKAKEPKLSDFFPAKEGMSWKYQGEGNEYASFTRKVLYKSGSKSQIREDNGGTVTSSIFEVTSNVIVMIYSSGEEYEDKNHLKSTPNENLAILKTPLKEGTKWDNNGDKREIVDSKAVVGTTAGEFKDCLKVKITDKKSPSTTYEYYKSGIGLVSREFVSENSVVSSRLATFKKE